MKKKIFLIIVSLSTLFTSCIRDEVIELDPSATTIVIEREHDEAIEIDGNLQVSARYIEANKEFEEAVFDWEIEDESIASVDHNGLVTAKNSGFTTIIAKAYGFDSDKLMIHVIGSLDEVFEAQLLTTKDALLISDTTLLTVTAQNINGVTVDINSVTYQSLDTEIATVSENGIVTALSSGDAVFKAIVDGVETPLVTIAIGNNPDAIATLNIVGDQPSIMENESLTLTTEIRNFNGDLLTGKEVVWTSSNTSIATVSTSGFVSTISEGNVTITASYDGVIDSFDLSVMNITSQFRSGTLMSIDYTTEGSFMLELTPENELKLHLMDFNAPQATSLPGVVFYLSNNLESANDAITNGLRIGNVTQGSGNYTIDITTSTDPVEDFQKYDFLFLICEPFKVPFSGGEIVD